MVDVAELKETKSEAHVPNETRVLELKAEPVSVTLKGFSLLSLLVNRRFML